MSEQKPSVWIVLISLLMLFVSGAWTIAAIAPFTFNKTLSSVMLLTATISNVSFLLTLLTTMLLYSEAGPEVRLRKLMAYFFSVGILALVVTVILFLIAFLISPPGYLG